jgi:glucosamine--fructose-6-phosphate aminotransferase (isomerizing)
MCGIVGYVGAQAALDVVLDGLGRLERHLDRPGYDSSGVAVVADGGLAAAKTPGQLAELRTLLDRRPLPTSGTAIGHIRQATHGAPSECNAHPQLDNAGRVAVVHDGVIDNHAELRAELASRGHELASQTDTEVVAHLLAEAFSSCAELAEAMRQVCRALRGTFAMLAVHADEPDAVVGARRALPLSVGLGDAESYLASDAAAFPGDAREVVTLHGPERDHVVLLRRNPHLDEVRCEITDVEGGVVLA